MSSLAAHPHASVAELPAPVSAEIWPHYSAKALFHAAHRPFKRISSPFTFKDMIRARMRAHDRTASTMAQPSKSLTSLKCASRAAKLGAALACVLGLASAAHAQGDSADPSPAATGPGSVVRETHGAWQVSCRTPPGAKEEKCALVQSVTAEDRPNVGLTVVFYKAIGEDKKLLRVVVPLGVLLPTGLGLKIDNQDVGNAPFLKCGKRGCVAEVVLQNEVIDKLKKGTNAMFIIFDTPEAGIGIPVSLQGFGDALAGLK